MLDVMLLAAGRGERMRPLSDRRPKPLLELMGKPLIVWQIEALARAGLQHMVINHAWLGSELVAALGDGSRFGVDISWSAEAQALGTGGGVAQALHLLRGTEFAVVSADIHTDFDYRSLHTALPPARDSNNPAQRSEGLAERSEGVAERSTDPVQRADDEARGLDDVAHLVLVDDRRVKQDFDLAGSRVVPSASPRLTYGNIGVFRRSLFAAMEPGLPADLGACLRAAVAQGRVSGAFHAGAWDNIGTPEDLQRVNDRLQTHSKPTLTREPR